MGSELAARNNVSLASVLIFSARANSCQGGIFLAYPDPPPEDFGLRLKRLAKAKGLKGKDIAARTGAHFTTVSRWMAGTTPDTEYLLALAGLLNVSPNYLLKGPPPGKLGQEADGPPLSEGGEEGGEESG